MRVRLTTPGAFPKEFSDHNVRDLGPAIAESIYDAIGDRTLGISQLRLKKLVTEIQLETNKEAFGIFRKAIQIITNSKSRTSKFINNPFMATNELTAFSASDLGTGSAVQGLFGERPMGSVNWTDLSQSWVKRKLASRPTTAKKFFIHKGGLLRTLKNGGYAASRIARFGGVNTKAKGTGELPKRRLKSGNPEFVLAELEIEIFPSIPSILLPMLASNRWTADSDGAFEKYIFGGTTGEKLAGPAGRHRPLFQPLTQFWIAYRIPAAIKRAINRTLRTRKRS